MKECPTCGLGIPPTGVLLGEIITCGDCGTELEVVSLEPFKVELAPPVQEDWGE
jgi:alpha-aminoadipate carrier protein LysW